MSERTRSLRTNLHLSKNSIRLTNNSGSRGGGGDGDGGSDGGGGNNVMQCHDRL